MRKLILTSQFKKDLKAIKKRGLDTSVLDSVVDMLLRDIKLPEQYHDHGLSGEYIGVRECQLKPDWLLLYTISGDKLILILQRTGSHSDLFR